MAFVKIFCKKYKYIEFTDKLRTHYFLDLHLASDAMVMNQ